MNDETGRDENIEMIIGFKTDVLFTFVMTGESVDPQRHLW